MKTLTDKNGKDIKKGSIVRHDEGWKRVSAVFSGSATVNLCGVFNDVLYSKRVPLADVYEDEAAWYQNWSQSESYRCM